jgi:1-acyl-sn-glycerol-3-phosphate acyltransferase
MHGTAGAGAAGIQPREPWYAKPVDIAVTLILWAYFTAGFAVLFGPFYLAAALVSPDRQRAFQYLNHLFYGGFFLLCRKLMPMQKWRIDPEIGNIRSSVIVCNHISYIDSILLISLFARHTTIVKNRLFGFPVLNWIMVLSGYLPSASEGAQADLLVKRLEALPAFFADGGNLIVFPEGTRSRTGAIGPLNTGAFKIAKMCHTPIAVLGVRNTHRLFTPGTFRFNTCRDNTITLDLLARLTPEDGTVRFTVKGLMEQVRSTWEGRNHP